jgi:hypothetical protein
LFTAIVVTGNKLIASAVVTGENCDTGEKIIAGINDTADQRKCVTKINRRCQQHRCAAKAYFYCPTMN